MRRLLLGAKCRQDQGEVYGSTSTNPRPLRWWQAEIWGPNQACKHVSSSGKFSSFHRSSAGFTSSQSKINHSSPSLFSDLCMTSTCSEKPAPSSRTPLMSYIRLSNGCQLVTGPSTTPEPFTLYLQCCINVCLSFNILTYMSCVYVLFVMHVRNHSTGINTSLFLGKDTIIIV